MNPADAPTVLGMLHKQMTSELGTSEITAKIHRETARNSRGSLSRAPYEMKWKNYSASCCSHRRGQLCFKQGGKYGEPYASHDTY